MGLLTGIGIASIVIGSLLESGERRDQARGTRDDAIARANAARANEEIARRNAVIILAESKKSAKRAERGGESLKSTQRAAFGDAGVLLTGSPQQVLEETERIQQEDIEAILTAGERGSQEALDEAENAAREARAARKRAGRASKAASIAPLATLIQGAGAGASLLERRR